MTSTNDNRNEMSAPVSIHDADTAPDARLIKTCNAIINGRAAAEYLAGGTDWEKLPPRKREQVRSIRSSVRMNTIAACYMRATTRGGCLAKASVVAAMEREDHDIGASLARDVLRVTA